MRRVLRGLPVFLIALLVNERRGETVCVEGPLKTSGGAMIRVVPVKLYAAATETQFLGQPISEMEWNIVAAAGAWWDQGGAWVRPYYAGRTTSTNDTGIILIRETNDCNACGTWACEKTHWDYPPPFNTKRVGSTLWFEHNEDCPPSSGPWSSIPYPGDQGTGQGFRQTVTHEMGHGLGLDHPEDCGQPMWSVMGQATSIIPRKDDILGLTLPAMYGSSPLNSQSWASLDMLSWTANPVKTMPYGMSFRPQGGGHALLAKRIYGSTYGYRACVNVETDYDLTYNFPDPSSPSGLTYQATAAARGETASDRALVWNADEDNTVSDKAHLRIATSRNAGSTWSVATVAGGPGQSMGAPTISFDPIRKRYLVFRHLGGSEASYRTFNQDGGEPFEVSAWPFPWDSALHAPVAACGTGVVGDYNCIVAWDSNNAYGCLNWREFRVEANGSLTFTSVKTQCYYQEDTPSLTYRQDDPNNKRWGIALRQGVTIYSFRKTYAGTAWEDERTVEFDPTNGVRSPAILQVAYICWPSCGFTYGTHVYTGTP